MGILNWSTLDSIESKGISAGKAGSLGALSEHRNKTLSQFFTTAWLVDFAWNTLAQYFEEDQKYSLFDNSIGSASMMRNATPDNFTISGIDIDSEVIDKTINGLIELGFEPNLICTSIEDVKISGAFSAALINPPFSIPLSSPLLTPYTGITHYGIHGPDTSALSHEYALAQALSCAKVVAAVVPSSLTKNLAQFACADGRLRAIYHLPKDTFLEQGVKSVDSDLLIFGRQLTEAITPIERDITPSSHIDQLPHIIANPSYELCEGRLAKFTQDVSKPAITLPVTIDKTVLISKSGRKVKLVFKDGLTQGKVLNALYMKKIMATRKNKTPKEAKYAGQFKLSIDVMIATEQPMACIKELARIIKTAGGIPLISKELTLQVKRLQREHAKMAVPFSRDIYKEGADTFSATSKKMGFINHKQLGAVIPAGVTVEVVKTDTNLLVTPENSENTFDCDFDTFESLFEYDNSTAEGGNWVTKFEPIATSFPQEIAQIKQRVLDLGLDKWLTWDYQIDDLVELLFKKRGICGWLMGLGKSRLILALAMMMPGKSLVVVKSRLVNEMKKELVKLGADSSLFNIIKKPSDINKLCKINIVSYEKLKSPIDKRFPSITLAHRIKATKKVLTVCCDEGGLIANPNSLQTKAVKALGTKYNFIFDGTPMPNYAREMLPLICFVYGESKSYQPYALNRTYIDKDLWNYSNNAQIGRERFNDDFVVLDWATNEFLDTGKGAKREIPKINPDNLGLFQNLMARFIKRRVQLEPAVAKHVEFPKPIINTPIQIDWEFEHLALYIETLDSFADWYKDHLELQHDNLKGINLTVVLAKLEAVFKAANCPSKVTGYADGFDHLTTKEIACVDMVRDQVSTGKRPIVFARNPSVLHRLSAELDRIGISNFVFTGEETIAKRIKKLDANIINGKKEVLLASIGTAQDGLNLPECNTAIYYNRSYKSREEIQALYRMVRPQQKLAVSADFLELEGSIDNYMGQMACFKTNAANAGIDFGMQPENAEYVHFEAFINRFLESMPLLKAKLDNLKKHSRKSMKAA